MRTQCATMLIEGTSFVVVLARAELFDSPSEADMAIERLEANFAGLSVVLMAQRDDGSPVYYGEERLVELMRGVDIEQMPWREIGVH